MGPVWRTLQSFLGKKEHETLIFAYLYGGTYLIWIHLGLVLIGTLALLILNITIYVKIRSLSSRSQHQRISTKKSSIVLFLVVATFFVFEAPHYVMTSIIVTDASIVSDFKTTLYISVSCIPFVILNTIADPLIYAFRISAIRKIYLDCLKKSHLC